MSCFKKCENCDGKGYVFKTVLDVPPGQISDRNAIDKLAKFFAKYGEPLEPYKEKTIKERCSWCEGTGKRDACEMEVVYVTYSPLELIFNRSLSNHSEYRCKKCGAYGGWWDPN